MQKAVFITGGTVGTGYATAERYAKEGYAVFITSRSEERAQEAADSVAKAHGVLAKGFGLDIRDEARIKEIFAVIDSLGCFVETVVLNSANMGFGTDPTVGMDFFTVPVEEFQEVSDCFHEDIYQALYMNNCVNGRKAIGGPAKVEVERQIAAIESFIASRT